MPDKNLLSLIDQIRAIGLEGLQFAEDPYDVARYEKLIEIVAQNYADLSRLSSTEIKDIIKTQIGIVTPKLGVDVSIINDANEVLALKRSDNGLWCLPGGWMDVGESPEKAAIREAREETGLTVEIDGYISVMTKGTEHGEGLPHQVVILAWAKLLSPANTLKISHEHTDFRWITVADDLEWSPGHKEQFIQIQNFIKSDKSLILPTDNVLAA